MVEMNEQNPDIDAEATPPSPKVPVKSTAPNLTPMLRQFLAVKEEHPDCLLFFRMGDFYEMFFEDAEIAAAAINITLTKRGRAGEDDVPMCGVPHHAADAYLTKLIRQGFKVAICEQSESPEEAKKHGRKGPLRREVVRVVTPGTLVEDAFLPPRENNYLAAIFSVSNEAALAWVDLSTGEVMTETTSGADLASSLARLNPAEVIVSDEATETPENFGIAVECISRRPVQDFDSRSAKRRLEAIYRVATLDGIAELNRVQLAALGALLTYLDITQKGRALHLKPVKSFSRNKVMDIDPATRKSLELTRTQSGQRKGSLLATIDKTMTAAGARLMAARLSAPLTDKDAIIGRLDLVEAMLGDPKLADVIRESAKNMPDIERALTRIGLKHGGPRDLASVAAGIEAATAMAKAVASRENTVLASEQFSQMADVPEAALEVAAMIIDALTDTLPLLARDGGFIRNGIDADLDEMFTLRDESKRLIATVQQKYCQATGISSLKIKHNNVLGYHIEVRSNHADNLMAGEHGFIHRQTTAQTVRFTTVELSDLEKEMSQAANNAIALEHAWFDKFTDAVVEARDQIMVLADVAAQLDVAVTMAGLTERWRYCRPQITDGQNLVIEAGRHPVVEQMITDGNPFVANDCSLGDDDKIWLLTGPNMAGKSTFLRQNALIAIMAQAGFYVPARTAQIGLVDKVFCRVGASDDLATGRSTFMVEMVETAAILNRARGKSLIILDEIGRGTATYDGLSLAWAVVEHLDTLGCRVLFATHYHEIAALETRLEALSCHQMRVREWKGDIVFLHEVGIGAADKSYGIHVARLAGVPASVLQRAETILQTISRKGEIQNTVASMPLFDSVAQAQPSETISKTSKIEEHLKTVNPDHLTPKDALDALYTLRALLDDDS